MRQDREELLTRRGFSKRWQWCKRRHATEGGALASLDSALADAEQVATEYDQAFILVEIASTQNKVGDRRGALETIETALAIGDRINSAAFKTEILLRSARILVQGE